MFYFRLKMKLDLVFNSCFEVDMQQDPNIWVHSISLKFAIVDLKIITRDFHL